MDSATERLGFWEGRYREGNTPWNTEQPSGELVEFLDSGRITSGTALDIGCGYGTQSVYLAHRGFRVTGVDFSPTAIAGARQRVKEGMELDFLIADLAAEPELGGPYDFLFDRGVYHILRQQNLTPYHRLLEKVSRPGTLYLCLTGNTNETGEGGPPRVSEEEIRCELGPLFRILDLHEFRWDPTPQMDTRPLGWSALMERK